MAPRAPWTRRAAPTIWSPTTPRPTIGTASTRIALRHGLSHGGAGQCRLHAHEGPAHRGLSGHVLQRRPAGKAGRNLLRRTRQHCSVRSDAHTYVSGNGPHRDGRQPGDEESLESNELHHGYFTYYLLQALKSGKGETPLSQVFATVEQQVSQGVSSQGMHQHPVMNRSSDDADFALRAAAPQSAKTPAPATPSAKAPVAAKQSSKTPAAAAQTAKAKP